MDVVHVGIAQGPDQLQQPVVCGPVLWYLRDISIACEPPDRTPQAAAVQNVKSFQVLACLDYLLEQLERQTGGSHDPVSGAQQGSALQVYLYI